MMKLQIFAVLLLTLAIASATPTRADVCQKCINFIGSTKFGLFEPWDSIMKKLDPLCDSLGLSQSELAVCKAMVRSEMDDLIEDIREGKAPIKICHEVKLC